MQSDGVNVHWSEWQKFVVKELMAIRSEISDLKTSIGIDIAKLKVKVGIFSAIISGVISISMLVLLELFKRGG